MKLYEKLEYLKGNHFDCFLTTHQRVFDEFSDQQQIFCCCGKLATGLHENNCKKFRKKVTEETVKRLEHLLPKKGGEQ